MATPTDLITAAQVKLNAATADIADAQTLLDQAKAGIQPSPPATLYALTVVNGSGSGSYEAGASVTVQANTPSSGMAFGGWTGPVAEPTQTRTAVIMPASAVTVTATYVTVTPIPPTPTGRIKTLAHLGSFKVPAIAGADSNGYAYGGTAMAYNPARNSLVLAGFDVACKVGELSIPAFGGTATVLQPVADPFGGKLSSISPTDPNQKYVGGTLVNGQKLITSAYVGYDGAGTQVLSHFVGPVTLGSGAVAGPLRVGQLGAGFYSGYMGWVDPDWRDRFRGPAFTGNACLNIISRTSYGPSVAAFDPSNISAIGAVELVGYPDNHQTLGAWNAKPPSEFFGGSDQVKGVAMPLGFGTVLFVGRHGTTFCYGEASTCGDPTNNSKGTHGYPYRAVAWFYDANDLAAVAAGTKAPWDVKPYAMIDLLSTDPNKQIGGCALDPATGRLYVAELMGNGTLPVIHIYEARS